MLTLPLVEPVGRVSDRHRCDCGTVDTDGAGGPPMVYGEPGAWTCASMVWFCRRCLRGLWLQHEQRQRKRAARLERLEAYRQGTLDICRARYLSIEDHRAICARLALRAVA